MCAAGERFTTKGHLKQFCGIHFQDDFNHKHVCIAMIKLSHQCQLEQNWSRKRDLPARNSKCKEEESPHCRSNIFDRWFLVDQGQWNEEYHLCHDHGILKEVHPRVPIGNHIPDADCVTAQKLRISDIEKKLKFCLEMYITAENGWKEKLMEKADFSCTWGHLWIMR